MKEPKDIFTIMLIVAVVAAAALNVMTFVELTRTDAMTRERTALTEQARALYEERSGEMEAVAGDLAKLIHDARERIMTAEANPETKKGR